MKNLLKYFSLALVGIVTFQGCDSLLDTEPKQSIDSEQVLTNPENVKSVLIGAYDAIGDSDLFGGWYLMTSDFLAANNEFSFTGTFFPPRQIWLKQQEYDNTQLTDTWNDSYNAINITNSVISALDLLEGSEKDRVEGETKFIRGV
ncbi:MAG: RagB/SusD family nutrient uptake outer membrane protein, partial [Balneolaceae bacterium]